MPKEEVTKGGSATYRYDRRDEERFEIAYGDNELIEEISIRSLLRE